MSALKKILEDLQRHKSDEIYYIPEKWNYVNSLGIKSDDRPGEILIEPYSFYANCIESILNEVNEKIKHRTVEGTTIYSMFPRLFSAWMHGKDKTKIQNGTFLKSLCLLPLLKKMGIQTVYLLPIFEMGKTNLKGELSSPYSIRNIMKIDPELHDPLLNDNIGPEIEFQAFTEACHCLGMNVMVDFVLRTVSRDNVLIEEHPDWFYWIHEDCDKTFSSPHINGIGQTVISSHTAELLYQSTDMEPFIKCFVNSPDKEEWNYLRKIANQKNISLLQLIKNEKHIVIMPGFADTINDPQPPWTDITFPKFYFDSTTNAKKYFDVSKLPSFIAQDGVKCSVFPGKKPNIQLWNYLKNVIPYYIRTYGIDGARIDMAHALPVELNSVIIQEIKKIDPKFLLWSEEFLTQNAWKAKQEGYSFITGGIWDVWDSINNLNFNEKISENLVADLPSVSTLEMADTPRSALILSNKRIWEVMLFLTALLPHSVMLINNGEELGEIQPMNLGLKNTSKGQFVLPKNHPLYGKLAFFDVCYLNWLTKDDRWEKIEKAGYLRNYFSDILQNDDDCNWNLFVKKSKLTVLLIKKDRRVLCAAFNRGCAKKNRIINWDELLKGQNISINNAKILYTQNASKEKIGSYGIIIMEIMEEIR